MGWAKLAAAPMSTIQLVRSRGVASIVPANGAASEEVRTDLFSNYQRQELRSNPAVAGSQSAVWVLHPYYGFVTNPDIDGVNKFGFLGYEDEIQPANPNNIVIAVIGGSVAAQLASAGDVLESELKKIASFQSKKLTI